MGNKQSSYGELLVDAMIVSDNKKLVEVLTILDSYTQTDEVSRKQFVEDDGIRIANELLSSINWEVATKAASVVANLALSNDLRLRLIEELDMQTMIHQMAIGSLAFQTQASRCFADMCWTSKSQLRVIELGLALPLLRLARSRDEGLKRQVTRAISRITENTACGRILIQRQIIGLLVEIVLSKDADTQIAAVAALANLAKGQETKKDLIENAILPRFFLWSHQSKLELMKHHALRGIEEFMVLLTNPLALKYLSPDDLTWLSSQSGVQFPTIVKAANSVHFNTNKINRLNPPEMLKAVVQKVSGVLPTDRVMVALLSIDEEELLTVTGADRDEDKLTVLMKKNLGREPREFAGKIGEVFAFQRIEKAHDMAQDDPVVVAIERATGMHVQSTLIAPLQNSKGNMLGIVIGINKRGDQDVFTKADEERVSAMMPQLSHMAQLIAQKIEAISLTESKGSEIGWEEKVMTSVQSLDLRTILRVLMSRAQAMLNSDRSSFAVYLPEADRFWVIIPNGMKDFTMDGNKGLIGFVKQSLKPLLVQDAHKHPAFNADIDKQTQYFTRSVLCIPIFNTHQDFVGVCQLINKKRGPFTQIDMQKLTQFVTQFVPAIQSKVPDLRSELSEIVSGREVSVVDILSGCITNSSPENRLCALRIVSAMVSFPPNHDMIVKHSMFRLFIDIAQPPLVSILGSVNLTYTPAMRAEALTALCNISANPKYQEAIVRDNTVSVFEHALFESGDDRGVLFQGLRGLGNLSQVPLSHSRLCRVSLIQRVLQEATYRKPRKRKQVQMNSLTEKQKQELFKEYEDEEHLRTHQANTTMQVIRILSGFAKLPDNVVTLLRSGAAKRLMALLQCQHNDIVASSIHCLSIMGQDSKVRQMLIENHEVRTTIIKMAEDPATHVPTLVYIGRMLTLLVEDRSLQTKFKEAYTFQPLFHLLRHPDSVVKVGYIEAMVELLKDPATHHMLEDGGIVDRIKELLPLGKSNFDIGYSCARCVQELCIEEPARIRLAQTTGLVQGLCALLVDDNNVFQFASEEDKQHFIEVVEQSLKALLKILVGERTNTVALQLILQNGLNSIVGFVKSQHRYLRIKERQAKLAALAAKYSKPDSNAIADPEAVTLEETMTSVPDTVLILSCVLLGQLCVEEAARTQIAKLGTADCLVTISRNRESSEQLVCAASATLASMIARPAQFRGEDSAVKETL